MGFASGDYTKSQYAGTLAATLAYFLYTQGDAVGLATFDHKISSYLPPRNRPGYLRKLLQTLERSPEGKATDLGPPLEQLAEMLNKRGMIVLISDLLTSIDRLEQDLGYLCAGGHDVVVFQVLDPMEQNFDYDTPSLFEDLESGKYMPVEPMAARQGYQQKLNRHLEKVGEICRKLGTDYHLFTTHRPFDLALLDFLHDRMNRARRISHRRSRVAGGRA